MSGPRFSILLILVSIASTTRSAEIPKFFQQHICACSVTNEPVICGAKQLEYANICEARCANEVECEPKVKPCACPRIFNPVICGGNKIQYPSSCAAKCKNEVECVLVSDTGICKSIEVKGRKGKTDKKKCNEYMKISKKFSKENSKKKPRSWKIKKWEKKMEKLGGQLVSVFEA